MLLQGYGLCNLILSLLDDKKTIHNVLSDRRFKP
jgi:hypothetical protein